MSKQVLLKSFLAAIGFTELRWKHLPAGLYCFNFHRVTDPATCDLDRINISCTPARLREALIRLRTHFEFISLDRLRAIHRHVQGSQRRRFAIITFDDGYLDNYEEAFPILRELDLPACFFIPTSYVGSTRLTWWDELAWMVRHATAEQFTLKKAGLSLDTRPERLERSIFSLLAYSHSHPKIDELIDEVRDAARPAGKPVDTPPFVTWDHLREMRQAGMEIGTHSHTHTILSHLDPAAQRDELAISKEIMEEQLGEPVTAVSYPVGNPTTFTSETCQIAQELGYDLGFSFIWKKAELPLPNPLAIPRLPGHGGDLKASLCYPWYRAY